MPAPEKPTNTPRCPFCHHALDRAPRPEQAAQCPNCRMLVTAHAPERAGDTARGLHVRDTRAGDTRDMADAGRACPHCGAPMASDAVLCVACGRDVRTGRRKKMKRRAALRRAGAFFLFLLLVGAGLAAWTRWGDSCRRWLERGEYTNVCDKVLATIADLTTNAVTAIREAPLTRKPDPAKQRELLAARLDVQCPLFQEGEEVALRGKDGIVTRGIYIGTGDGKVCLEGAGAEEVTVEVTLLDCATRLRCDLAFREAFIEARCGK
ncbi:MAG: hypothetical protein JXB04_03920 [Kiritimatiellae bacterium]|nr:hypothetical protein [Kiritimatiellia bacterium]